MYFHLDEFFIDYLSDIFYFHNNKFNVSKIQILYNLRTKH